MPTRGLNRGEHILESTLLKLRRAGEPAPAHRPPAGGALLGGAQGAGRVTRGDGLMEGARHFPGAVRVP